MHLVQILARTNFRTALAAGVSLLAMPLAEVRAQDAAEQHSGLEEIIVTAQKRAENIQDTPISMSVLGESALEQQGITGLRDLMGGAIPSLRIAPFSGRPSALNIAMRGISSGDATQISRDGAIALYVDGVYLARVQGLGTELFDLERIEVLRGPQGTLFGRNAVGGALNIISKRPSGEFGVDAKVGLANYDGRTAEAHVNLPEFAGIRIKLDGMVSRRDGLVDNPLRGAWDWGAYRREGFRAQALWQPTDAIELLYSFDVSRDRSSPNYMQIEGTIAGGAPIALPPIFSLEPDRVRRARIGVPLEPSVAKVSGHSLNASWELSDALTLRSITAYRKLSQTQEDNDIGHQTGYRPNGNFARSSAARVDQDQFSQELQLIGTTDHLNYVLGAYLFNEDASDWAYASFVYRWNDDGTAYTVNNPPSGGVWPDRASDNHARSRALFGQATWTPAILDERLHLTGGLRYTHDKKHGRIPLLRGAPAALTYQFTSSRLDPMATIAFDFSRDVNAYAKYSIGYRAGGANGRSATYRPFAEEEVRSWEVGLKSEFWDRRARLNIAAYSMDYRDMQIDFSNPANPSAVETLNTNATAKIKGIEVDLTLAPFQGFTLTGSYSFTDAKIPPLVNPFSGVLANLRPAFTPRNAASLSADYAVPVGDMTLKLHADFNYSGTFPTSASSPVLADSYLLTNARITLADIALGGAPKLSLSLWGKNLFNEDFQTFRFNFGGSGLTNDRVAALNDPRTYGVELSTRF
ncbi:TonB-denpendent receptor [Sphingobium baderi LL03]|nr:TonB-denpendent receptor [Sphingobium baderi LL03]